MYHAVECLKFLFLQRASGHRGQMVGGVWFGPDDLQRSSLNHDIIALTFVVSGAGETEYLK